MVSKTAPRSGEGIEYLKDILVWIEHGISLEFNDHPPHQR